MKNVEKELNIKEMSDWYKVTQKDLEKHCSRLFNKYGKSTTSFLTQMYPEYDWLPWKFVRCPNSYWEDINNQKKFINWAANELGVQSMSEWYNVSTQVNTIVI